MISKFGRYLPYVFAVILIFSVGDIIFFFNNLTTIHNNENWIKHTLEVKAALGNTLQSLSDAETGERGYLLSNNEKFLDPYAQAIPRIEKDFQNVRALTTDNLDQQKKVIQLDSLAKKRINYLTQAINLKKHNGLDAQNSFVNVEEGRVVMVQIRNLIDSMQKEENALLQIREIATANNYFNVYLISYAVGVLNLILLILAYYLLRKELQQRSIMRIALEAKEAHFRALIEHGSEGVALINPKGEILYVSASVKKVLGYTPHEYLKLNRFTRMSSEDGNKLRLLYSNLKSGKTFIHFLRFKHKNGKWIWLEANFTNMLNDPNIKAIVVNFRDISDRLELEKRKDEFISMASHELKTPLTSMKMFLQLLQKQLADSHDSKVKKYLQTISDQTNKLIELTVDLLDVSRIETGKLSIEKEKVDLHNIIKDTLESVQPTLIEHRINYRNNVHAIVFADRFRISQVITNFLTNASKYSNPGSQIMITLKKNRTEAILAIQDYGIGITKEQQSKVFEKLYQINETTSKHFSGLGMGLFICKEIIKLHKGRIWVESVKGKGSTFYFTLPIAKTK